MIVKFQINLHSQGDSTTNYLQSVCNRPQRSCGKVMFLHQSVILSMGGCLPDTPWIDTTPGQIPPWADTSPQQTLTTPFGRPPGRHLPLPSPSPQEDSYCYRWYASVLVSHHFISSLKTIRIIYWFHFFAFTLFFAVTLLTNSEQKHMFFLE